MYYSIILDNTPINGDGSWNEHSFIGMMETTDPASNNWEDKGFVICSSSDKGFNWNTTDLADAYYRWNAIDPSYIITPEGKHYLIYGSWHSGIVALEVDANSGLPVNTLGNPWGNSVADIANYGTCIYTRQMNNRWQGSEGPEIIYHDGYYYLFLAYDALAIPYNTRVVRSKSILGPYLGIDGTDCTNIGGDAYPIVTHPYKFANNPGWVGISHCAIFEDGDGNWYYASQGRLPENAYGNAYANAIMLGHVRSIRWTKDGWPVVMPERYGAVPQVAITQDELIGDWEHIDLGYSYGIMKESSTMTLSPDGTITAGTWQGGKWSFDEENQILTANGVELYLARECDWEASPRTHTIVYSGINNKKTYWGKKTK
jgi:beta-xylosidase